MAYVDSPSWPKGLCELLFDDAVQDWFRLASNFVHPQLVPTFLVVSKQKAVVRKPLRLLRGSTSRTSDDDYFIG